MAKLIIDNLSMEQAKQFATWYENQGEQDADVWFEISKIETPWVDYSKGQIIDEKNETITIFIKD